LTATTLQRVRATPFDLILIDGAVEHIPQALIDRLAEGGRLAAGLRESGSPA
jgi:protein-L-isoaspartate(D-aspartate) O-methyltransferase